MTRTSLLLVARSLVTPALVAGLSIAATAPGCVTTTTEVDAGATPDGGGEVDSGPEPEVDGGGEPTDAFVPPVDGGGGEVDGGGSTECGGARPTISSIRGTEGLVIARDGTIYYSQSGGVGRMTPDGTQDDEWVAIAGAGTVWGLALDAANELLYVGSPSTGAIHVIDTTAATPTASTWLSGAGAPNGLTMGPDGAVYYSDFSAGRVYRVPTGSATGTRTQVTTSSISQANGVAFLADGTLLVASYATGTIHRLTLTAGAETGRATFATGAGNPDGIAIDATGRVYVTDNSGGEVIRFEADGTSPMTLLTGVSSAANLEFGTGPLDCEDLYVTSGGTLRRYQDGTTAGAAVPWH